MEDFAAFEELPQDVPAPAQPAQPKAQYYIDEEEVETIRDGSVLCSPCLPPFFLCLSDILKTESSKRSAHGSYCLYEMSDTPSNWRKYGSLSHCITLTL